MADELAVLYARLYLDQDVPVQLAGMLRAQGIDVLTTLEAGMLGRDDSEQLEKAVAEGRAMVTPWSRTTGLTSSAFTASIWLRGGATSAVWSRSNAGTYALPVAGLSRS
jgi:hypothetical protein